MSFRLIYVTPIIILIFGCNVHQYLSFSGELPKNNQGAFFEENDTLGITYTFQGNNTIMVELANQSERLLFVDWSRSSMIFNGQSLSFISEMSKVEGTGTANQYIQGTTSANFEVTISQSSTNSYIPPNSKISREFSGVPIPYFKDLRKTHSFEKILLPSVAKKFSFDEKNTLSNIRSYISVGIADKSNLQEIKHSFWMTDIVETGEGKLRIKGNQLRVSKQTSTGAVLTSVATAAILATTETQED